LQKGKNKVATLGIDIGGSGIKGAPVDLETGDLVSPRFRIDTPIPAKPDAVAGVVSQIAQHFGWSGKIGCGFPAVIIRGKAFSAANVHKSWIGTDAEELFTRATNCKTRVINDADAAGLAEMAFGAGRKWRKGVVFLITVGTGLGTAIFVDNVLLPNTEFGHLEIRGKDAEKRASDAARQVKDLSWVAWADNFNEYLQTMERLINMDVVIIGGGISKEFNRFSGYLNLKAEIISAELLNQAGIIGAALAAERGG
jgi:polyphosphate glucokinase